MKKENKKTQHQSRIVPKDENYISMMSEVNPFFLMSNNSSNEYLIWRQAHEPYWHVLFQFYTNCPRGFIELAYILSVLYPRMRFNDVLKMSSLMQVLKTPEIVEINYGTKEAKIYFEQFFTSLCGVWGTKFNHTAFNTAYGYTSHLTDILLK